MSIFSKIIGDSNKRALKKLEVLVKEINGLESQFRSFSDEQLKQKTEEFKKRLKENPGRQAKVLDKILSQAFALVREAGRRTIGERAFDTQLMCGITLHQGQIAELKTGEGKTLGAVFAVYLNALTGRGVHVVTVNDYLARRDTNWMGPIYNRLGLSCACLNHQKAYAFTPQTKPDQDEVSVEMENLKEVSRQQAYRADITYGTNHEFGFDYLRDNMAPSLAAMAQREPYFAVIDEIDSILIDEARTPLIISAPDADSTRLYEYFARIVPGLKENLDYNVDEKMRTAVLTEAGIAKVEKILGLGNIYQEGGIRYVHHLEQALRAQVLFKRDRDYVVKNGQVIIVDEFTGRLMPGRRYNQGLHQALEAKEKVRVEQESRTLASITLQNYFRMYPKLAGMTGTAATSAEEFHKVYNLEVVVIPTNKPMIRRDLEDVIYKTEEGKFRAIAEEVKKRHQKGQPVLIGTVSIEKNELLSSYLKKAGISHQVLNAKNHEQEAQIIAQAGQRGAVTVATNMAGRGVDIVLGGRADNTDGTVPARDSGSLKHTSAHPYSWQEAHDEVVKLGGLYVIGTERHEARRIDDQLRGRSGRQGDPGSSQFFVSLDDDLMRIFGGDRVKSIMETLKVPADQPIENKLISRAISSAQARVEGYNFDLRRHVLEYDDVLNKQRETIYKKRREILDKKNIRPDVLEMIEDEIRKIVGFHAQSPRKEERNYKEIAETMKAIFPVPDNLEEKIREVGSPDEISDYLISLAKQGYENKEKELTKETKENAQPLDMRRLEKFIVLRSLDGLWMEHLETMDYLRQSVRLRAYGQKDPLVEYKNEGRRLFQRLLTAIQSAVVNTIFKVSLMPSVQQKTHFGTRPLKTSEASDGVQTSRPKKLGRNSPCPCGATYPDGRPKKYKHCCGAKT